MSMLPIKRDLLLIFLLIGMVKIAQRFPTKNTALSSKGLGKAQQDRNQKKPFTIHEIDPVTVAQMQETKQLLDQAASLMPTASSELTYLKQQLARIEREYRYTSPVLALLGPIGSTSIVIKERRIEREMKRIVLTLNTLLSEQIQKEDASPPHSIAADPLEYTHALIAHLKLNIHPLKTL